MLRKNTTNTLALIWLALSLISLSLIITLCSEDIEQGEPLGNEVECERSITNVENMGGYNG